MELAKTLQYNSSIHKTEEDLIELSRDLGFECREVEKSIDWTQNKPFQEQKKEYMKALVAEAEKVEEAFNLLTHKVKVGEDINLQSIYAGL